jgi:sugar lactone lactonase YvrE
MSNRSLAAVLAIATCLTAVGSMAQIINTFAGGRTLNGLPALNVGLGYPGSVVLDAAGNLFVADRTNNVVFRIDAQSGIATVVAGNGTLGFSGDGGPATAAQIGTPVSIALDPAGNLYIVDSSNNRVRRVDAATKTITTFAGGGQATGDGGPATSAQLAFPEGVGCDLAGNVYVAEFSTSRVRKIDAGTKIIITVAGNGTSGYSGDGGPATAAMLRNPFAVSVDSSGNLFITDTNNYAIRKVAAATGIITTVAGGSFGFAGDGGPATVAKFGLVVTTIVDSAGNLWMADFYYNRIRKVDTAGVISTVAGTGTRAFSGDGGLATAAGLASPDSVAVDPAGNLYIADQLNQRVRKVDASTKNISTIVGLDVGDGGDPLSAQLLRPTGVAVASSGNIYIAEVSNRRIRKIDATTKVISTFAGGVYDSTATVYGPATIIVDAVENVYFADSNVQKVLKVDAVTKSVSAIAGGGSISGDGGPATAASLSLTSSSSIAFDGPGSLLIADTNDHRIRRVDLATGIITTIAGNGQPSDSGDAVPAPTAGIASPAGMVVDRSGNIYFSEFTNMIRRIDPSGTISTVVSSGLNVPTGLAIDNDGNILIADSGSNTIKKLDLTTKAISTIAGDGTARLAGDPGPAASASLNSPRAFGVSPSGAIYVADANNNRVRVITTLPLRHRGIRK